MEQLKSLPHFNKMTVCQMAKQYGLTDSTIDTYISRFLKRKEIFQLKKGLYVSYDFFKKTRSEVSYSFYLANILRTPSYVSSWAALQYYNLATEAIYTITSVTLKNTRAHETKAGNFVYHSIKKELFSEFHLEKRKFDFFIASPSKALFDLLYFKTRQFRGVRFEDIKVMVDDLRIDIGEMDKKEQASFYTKIKKYINYV